MNSWWIKFRISQALDSGKPLPASLRQKIAVDPELARFARPLPNPPPVNPSLHDSIMRAVRASARREPQRRASGLSWLAALSSLAALVGICLWMFRPDSAPPTKPSLDQPLIVLEMSERMPAAMPSMVVAPLSNEWARVNHDFQETTQVLLASFP